MFDFIARENPEYVDALYREYRRDPRAVDERWAFVFSAYELGLAHGAGGATGPEVGNLVHSYRDLGHLIADLEPLGSSPRQHPLLRLEEFGIREADLRVDECEGFRGWGRVTLRELLAALRDTYRRTLGIEYMGIPDKERRDSPPDRMGPSRNHPALSPDQRRRILERLIAAEGFEQFLHAKYVTATRFSLKGGEALMPLLDTVVEEAGGLDAQELVLDIPHRGRLNVLAHVRGKPGSFLPSDVHGDGDVKYHLGYSHDVEPAGGRLPIVGRRPLGEGYSYGTYEISPERAAFYRERLSPTLRRTPEARLDFASEGRHYIRRERRNSPEYMREVEQLALRQDGERTMANACRVVACIPVYTLGEGKIVEHALEQYRKQITNGSVEPEEFEVLLFLNHPKDKLTDIHIAPGAEERVRTGHPESYDTKEVIRQYRARYPELRIYVIEKEFATRPNWGWIIKYAYDAAALRAQARKHPVDADVIILANDVDVRDTSGTYLRQLIETFDKNKKDVGAGKIPRIDGVVGRIDHDTTTYRTWPNFFAVTRFEQFLDAQNRRGYPGRQPHTPPEAEGDGYALRVRRRGEKHVVTQGRNTALRASAYCAVGGANTETDVGADTELGRMVTFARRGVLEKTLHTDEYTLTYSPVMWLETDPRRELGMYRKGEPVARAWSEWEAMNVYGKSFSEQIAGETEELNTGRLEKEFKEILKKWGLSANAPSVERALAWLGLAKKDEATREYIYKDYEILPDAEGEPMIEITNLDHLRQHIARWKPKRERVVSAKSRAK